MRAIEQKLLNKITDCAALKNQVDAWQSRKQKVVFY